MEKTTPNTEIKLQRVLKLRDLVIYGIILIQPGAALPLFGHANNLSQGHAVTAILIAMTAMIFTAISYGRMANRYPAAGSAYTYVGRGLNPNLGFIAGWSMFLDYLIIPIICVIYTAVTASHILPLVPYHFWIILFTVVFTLFNLRGIKFTSRANQVLLIAMSFVVFYFMAAAVRYIVSNEGITALFTTRPFYNPNTFSWGTIWSGTSLAALTYIGFDGLTTLSEEVENPRRNILIATVLTCVITGIWSGAQIYLAQASWPDWISYIGTITNEYARNNALDTAIMETANRIGGIWLDSILSFTILVAHIGSGTAGLAGAARLLYGMGRDKILPKKFFGHLDSKYAEPSYNVIFIGTLTLIGAFTFNYEECARLINFGAFLAFMAVNIAAIREYYFRNPDKSARSFFINFLPPAAGTIICFYIWSGLPLKTFIIGSLWTSAGAIYIAVRTNGFRKKIDMFDFLNI